MTIVLVIVLIALAFGFVFSKLDGLYKMNKQINDEIDKLKERIDDLEKK